MDVSTGIVSVDERDDTGLGMIPKASRHTEVRPILAKCLDSTGAGSVPIKELKDALRRDLEVSESYAKELVSDAKRAGLIESARLGYYRLPGGLLERRS
jgi:hypothetical protein